MRQIALHLILLLLLTSCGGGPASSAGKSDPVILTSTTILADIARNIAGDRVRVESLVPMGADPHSYQPTPQDAARLENSELLIVNGAGYERFLQSLPENASAKKTVIEAAAGLHPGEEAEGEQGVDPHLWLDPNQVITYVENIREGLTHFDPDGAAVYQSGADAYAAQLKDLNLWIEGQVSQVPSGRKLLITNHEALGYFAARYSFTIIGTVIRSSSADASPSAQQIAGLIDQIRSSGAPAIFLDASDNPAIAEQIADETGVRVVADLHLESLTDGAPAATYIDMMKYNVTRIVDALK